MLTLLITIAIAALVLLTRCNGLELLSSSAAASIVKKQQQSIYRGAAQTDIIPLSKQNLFRDLAIRLVAAPTLTAGHNSVANTKKGDEWSIISRIRLVVNGTDVLVDVSGDDLWWINHFCLGTRPRITPTLGDGATANVAIDSTLIIPVWLYRSRRPMDGAFESYRANSFQLEITYQDWTALNASATAWTTQPSVEITSSEMEPTPNFVPMVIPRIYKTVNDYSTAQTQARIQLDTGPYHRAFLINTSANGGGNDTVAITNARLIAGSTVLRDLSIGALLNLGELWSGVDPGIEIATTGIATQTNKRISGGSNPKTWFWVPVCVDGLLSEAIRTPVSGDLYWEITTSGAARVSIIAMQVFPNPFARQQDAAAA